MFTGLIEEIGIIKQLKPLGGGISITISSSKVIKNVALGDSININGACQTVVNFDNYSFEVVAVEETLKKTNLGKLKLNEKVNLESSLTLNKKLGGHIVLGHVDSTGKIINIKKLASSNILEISYQRQYSNYLINVGAIAVEGISLTIADFNEKSFNLSIIQHTWNETNLNQKTIGSEVNLEFDVLGKYVARILGKDKNTGISEEWLKEIGF